MLAYEFLFQNKSEIFQRRQHEKKSLEWQQKRLEEYISKWEQQIIEHIANITQQFQEYTEKIDTLKEEKKDIFETWFENTKNEEWENGILKNKKYWVH